VSQEDQQTRYHVVFSRRGWKRDAERQAPHVHRTPKNAHEKNPRPIPKQIPLNKMPSHGIASHSYPFAVTPSPSTLVRALRSLANKRGMGWFEVIGILLCLALAAGVIVLGYWWYWNSLEPLTQMD
jgi:hypothetical protein